MKRRPLFPTPLPPAMLPEAGAARPPVFFYFVAVLMLLLITVAAWRKIDDSMLLLHLKAGENILQNLVLIKRDTFSAGSFTEYWTFIQWTWAVVLAQVYKMAEWTGLALLNVCLVAITTVLMLWRSRRHGGRWFETLVTTGACLGVLLPAFQPNTTAAAMLLFLLSLIIVESQRLRWLVFLPVIAVVWTNLHPASLLPAFLPLARLAFPPPPAGREVAQSPISYLFIISSMAVIAVLISPYSFKVAEAIWLTAGRSINETFTHFGAIYTEPWALLRLAAVAIFVGLIIMSRITIYGWQILVAITLLLAAIISPVALNFLLVYLAAPVARALSQLMHNSWQIRPVRAMAATALLLSVLTTSALAIVVSGLRPDALASFSGVTRSGIRPNIFPETAASRLASLPLRNAILNHPDHGGYIVWRTWPLWKITADNRQNLYSLEFRQQYDALWQGAEGWEKLLQYWHVAAVLGSPEVMRQHPENNLYYKLADSDDWKAVYWDSESILYLRSDVKLENSNLQPYRRLKPGLSWAALADRVETPRDWRDLAADLRRATSEDRHNRLAWEYLELAEEQVAKLEQ